MSQNLPLLALDAGQTGIRAMLISDQKVEKDFPGMRTDIELFPQLAKVVHEVLAGQSTPVTLAVGMTALTRSHSDPDELLSMLDGKVRNVYLAHDSITGFLGAIGLEQGTVTAVGTGVVTLAVGPKKLARVDGWGNLIGDAGSAYWIGRAGLEAGMKAYDGRIPKSDLTNILRDNFSHPEEAYIELQTDSNRVAVIASFAKQVIELAHKDSAAKEIIEQAGKELALSAATAAKNAGLLELDNPVFSWAGNVMRADLLRSAFIESLQKMLPNAIVQAPIGEPIKGVALLPSLPKNSPLQSVVHQKEEVSA